MFEKPAELRKLFEQRAAEIAASSDLEQLRIEFLGKKGHVSGLMQELRNVPNDRKKEAGQRINETKQFIENALAQKFEELKKLEEQRLIESAESYDESMPVYTELGSYHPITLVQRELEDIFLNMGFSIEDYSEVTDDYNCFEGVNIPKHHVNEYHIRLLLLHQTQCILSVISFYHIIIFVLQIQCHYICNFPLIIYNQNFAPHSCFLLYGGRLFLHCRPVFSSVCL